MSKRTVYRDLRALETELQFPLWSEGGRWGVQPGAFLPPLRLTLPEAMAVFLSARLVTRYADKYEPHLASAFQKLEEGLPDALREHVERTLDDLARATRRPGLQPPRRGPHAGLGGAAGRPLPVRAGALRRDRARAPLGRGAPVPARAVAGDPRPVPDRARRDARRPPDVQGRADPRPRRSPPRTFEPPEAGALAATLRRAWDIIADQPETEVVLRFDPVGQRTGPRGDVAPEPGGQRGGRTARSSGGPGSRARSRSGCGSCRGATRSRSSPRRPSARTSPATLTRAAARYSVTAIGRPGRLPCRDSRARTHLGTSCRLGSPTRGPLSSAHLDGDPASSSRRVAPRSTSPRRSLRRLCLMVAAAVARGDDPRRQCRSRRRAATSASMANRSLGSMNRDREQPGLVAYRTWGSLTVDRRGARRRAWRLGNALSHDAAGGDIGARADTPRGIQWYGYGEIIGVSAYPLGQRGRRAHLLDVEGERPARGDHVQHALQLHRRRLSPTATSNGTTWASVVFTDSKDHTGAGREAGRHRP